ncbi:urea ABC transporter ATP-binding subunit UrtE [Ketobacter alkanivorans]|uniref:Urea ABC transporter ATP-binding subunit UrtE n=1 Tax=Ketobacter alkanivorans TaxID=1917421 RepID=A0A2K9LMC1_9GAMM|nr:urea ABC transporter ATP-binding subunit UrtE [Ketobacter alkanivorans]AUM12635.1 urea ABC transporter ATP-binding subunit UrtE [Ketobacter alkanivorans]MCP5014992.1 urea ABC transporter ATP-binding subunit UrtE [Ketobacter sp.]
MLKIDNIDLYYGASQALKKVSFEADKGQVACVMGRNGVGKTSLMRAVAGQHPIKSGQILWEGKDISGQAPHERAKNGIAYVPQGRDVFSQLTVLENLKTGFSVLPRAERKISDEIYELFPVLYKMLKRRGGDLSGGQQQQLAIARALVTKPKLLILDEPTEGIQPSIIKDIQKVISLLRDRGEMAILLVEQYFDFARELADNYAVMDRGEVVLAGLGKDMEEDTVRRYIAV